MTDSELDEMIDWCKKKLKITKKYRVVSGKRLEGYEMAMLCVMSYLHRKKED